MHDRRMQWAAVDIVYGGLAFLLGRCTGWHLPLILAWNVTLASVAPILTAWAALHQRRALYPLALVFWPNGLYLVTDLIHLRQFAFYTSSASHPVMDLGAWGMFFLVVSGAGLGVWSSVEALETVLHVEALSGRRRRVALLCAYALCAFGIYIGRVLRWNSWDILRPQVFFPALWRSITGGSASFFMGFLSLFTVLGCMAHALVAPFVERRLKSA